MSEIARGKRFSLLGVTGYPIWPGDFASSNGSTNRASTSYCIVDRDWNYREVWRAEYPIARRRGNQGGSHLERERKARAKLDEFEAKVESA